MGDSDFRGCDGWRAGDSVVLRCSLYCTARMHACNLLLMNGVHSAGKSAWVRVKGCIKSVVMVCEAELILYSMSIPLLSYGLIYLIYIMILRGGRAGVRLRGSAQLS